MQIPEDAERVVVSGRHEAQVRRPLFLRINLGGRTLGVGFARRKGPFTFTYPCPPQMRGHRVIAKIRSLWTWRPHLEGDSRRLSCFIDSVEAL